MIWFVLAIFALLFVAESVATWIVIIGVLDRLNTLERNEQLRERGLV